MRRRTRAPTRTHTCRPLPPRQGRHGHPSHLPRHETVDGQNPAPLAMHARCTCRRSHPAPPCQCWPPHLGGRCRISASADLGVTVRALRRSILNREREAPHFCIQAVQDFVHQQYSGARALSDGLSSAGRRHGDCGDESLVHRVTAGRSSLFSCRPIAPMTRGWAGSLQACYLFFSCRRMRP